MCSQTSRTAERDRLHVLVLQRLDETSFECSELFCFAEASLAAARAGRRVWGTGACSSWAVSHLPQLHFFRIGTLGRAILFVYAIMLIIFRKTDLAASFGGFPCPKFVH